MLYVKRGSGPKWRGYYVQIPGLRGKLFSKSKYDTWKKTFNAATRYAIKFTDRARYNLASGRFVKAFDSRSRSGIVGVRRLVGKRFRKRGLKSFRYVQWVAFAQLKLGRTTKRYFSVTKYGEKLARAHAIDARKAMIARILK